MFSVDGYLYSWVCEALYPADRVPSVWSPLPVSAINGEIGQKEKDFLGVPVGADIGLYLVTFQVRRVTVLPGDTEQQAIAVGRQNTLIYFHLRYIHLVTFEPTLSLVNDSSQQSLMIKMKTISQAFLKQNVWLSSLRSEMAIFRKGCSSFCWPAS